MKQLIFFAALGIILVFTSCDKKVGEIIWGSNWEDSIRCIEGRGPCKAGWIKKSTSMHSMDFNKTLKESSSPVNLLLLPAAKPHFSEDVFTTKFSMRLQQESMLFIVSSRKFVYTRKITAMPKMAV